MRTGYKILACSWLMLFPALLLTGQADDGCDRKFIFHLVANKYYEEAIYLTDSKQCKAFLNNDSIEFLRGWSYYKLNLKDNSLENLMRVDPGSPFYLKARFYSAFQLADSGIYDSGAKILQEISTPAPDEEALRAYEIAGINLLNENYSAFHDLITRAGQSDELTKNISSLKTAYDGYVNKKNKSPAIAGLMSAVIPGSGRLYCGRKGDALTSFISVAGLGLVTWENYRHKGIRNFGTLLSGAFFSFFYISNIYGSAVGIIVRENENKEDFRKTVLFNLRVPLDTFFR